MAIDNKKLLEELKRRALTGPFTVEDSCFAEQIKFINDPAKRKVAVTSRRCLAKDTLVLTTKGPKKIQEIKVGDFVYSEHGQPIEVKDIFSNGIKPVVSLIHNSREYVKCTLDHVFLTEHNTSNIQKERPVSSFYENIKIVRKEINRNIGVNIPYAYAIGALLGDGCSLQGSSRRVYISSADQSVVEKVSNQLNGKFNKCHANNFTWGISTESIPIQYKNWCENRYAHQKICDIDEILTWNRESRLQFIAGLLDTDGSVTNQKDGIQIRISMQAKSVVDACVILFQDLFQYRPSVKIDNRDKYKNGPVYDLTLKHNYFGKKILKELNPYLQVERKKFKQDYEDKKENNYRPDRVGFKIKNLGEECETYDIHVDSPTNLYLLADGLVTHNSGKTSSCARDLVYTAIHNPGDVLYITLSRVTAKRIIWKELLLINKKYKLNARIDNTELSLTLPNGNTIYISGAKDESEIEKFRGLALRKIYIDEAQSFRTYIKELIDDVLEPCLTDYDGTLVLIGTPGPVPAGFFWECWDNEEWSRHTWTIHNNPFIKEKSGKDPELIIEEICKRRGVSKSDPSIQREFYGKWVEDTDSLVFKFNPSTNVAKVLPPKEELEFIFGIDIGYNDSDAIAVLGYSRTQKVVYLYEEYVKAKQTISELVSEVERLRAKYNPVKMIMDAGALGKKIQAEIQQRFSLNLMTADKNRKFEYIELLNDDLRTGRLKVYGDSKFQEDCYLVQWDRTSKEKLKISDTYHSDITDAVLYAWRECRHYFSEPEKVKLKPFDPGYMEEHEQRLMEEYERKQQESDLDPSQDDMKFIVGEE